MSEPAWIPPMEFGPEPPRRTPPKPEPAPEPPAPVELEERAVIALAEPAPCDDGREGNALVASGGLAASRPPRSRIGRWLAAAVGVVVTVAVGFDTADLLTRAFQASWALGAVTALAVGVAAGTTLILLGRELAALRRLRRIEALRAEADRLTRDGGHGEGDRFAGALSRLYRGRGDLAPAMTRLGDLVSDAHDDGEVIRLIDREVLAVIDRAAYQKVVRAARDTAVVTALSPAAVIDVAVVLWRNLGLVRAIAELYGARPGYLGGLRLLRRMLANLAVAGVTESAHHVAVDALGGTLLAAVSTRIGQGMINGLLTARVGLAAMHLCRPLAFGPDNRPSLGRIRAELMALPKDVL